MGLHEKNSQFLIAVSVRTFLVSYSQNIFRPNPSKFNFNKISGVFLNCWIRSCMIRVAKTEILTSGLPIQHSDEIESAVITIFHVNGVKEEDHLLAVAHLDQSPAICAVRIIIGKSRTAQGTRFFRQQVLAIWKKKILTLLSADERRN